jgi:transcriptional regulator with XRE-family HTH domain
MKHPTDVILKDKVAEIVDELIGDESPTELNRRIGWNKGTLHHIQNGKFIPTLSTLYRLAEDLDYQLNISISPK